MYSCNSSRRSPLSSVTLPNAYNSSLPKSSNLEIKIS